LGFLCCVGHFFCFVAVSAVFRFGGGGGGGRGGGRGGDLLLTYCSTYSKRCSIHSLSQNSVSDSHWF
jgi:hypothetical protein